MKMVRVAGLTALLGTAGCVVQPAPQPVYVAPAAVVPIAPPAPVVEVIPAPPGGAYVWTPGYWSWNGRAYYWTKGHYVARPYARAVWVPPRWVRSGSGWVLVPGRWR